MNVPQTIQQAIDERTTRFALEMLPPLKGEGMEGIFEALDPVAGYDPAYINITFHREVAHERRLEGGGVERHVARRRPGTVGISAAIRDRYDVEVVPHLICAGQSRYDLEDALIDMDFLGLHNVLALRGDKSPAESGFTPHPEGHAHAARLVEQIAAMNRGEYIDEKCAPHRTHFSIGVAGYPEKHLEAADPTADLLHLRQKVAAGAQYIVTQMFFDNRRYFDFVARCRKAGIGVPIIPGIKPLASLRHLEVLPGLFGVTLPEALRSEMLRHRDDEDAIRRIGIEWTVAQARELKAAGVPVIHFYTMSRTKNILCILKQLF